MQNLVPSHLDYDVKNIPIRKSCQKEKPQALHDIINEDVPASRKGKRNHLSTRYRRLPG